MIKKLKPKLTEGFGIIVIMDPPEVHDPMKSPDEEEEEPSCWKPVGLDTRIMSVMQELE
ncbi:hypothetical protein AX14_003841, partial [Amanita brunnescens Koide BX004]